MSTRSSRWTKYRPVIALSILSMLVCGLAYPLVITGIAQAALPYQADGSQARLGGRAVGSYYIDNGFTLPGFFHGRNETNPLTASASGVDPDITVAEALSQVPRISNATGIARSSLVALVTSHEHWTLWVTGTPYVNVLELNLALIAAYPSSYPGYA